MIHPSIDLLGGKVVQLRGGDPNECRVALDDVFGVAERMHRCGELAVIDLDAALGRGDNLALIEALCARFDCRVGGGIRDHERADALLRAGARKLIIGTRATPEFLSRYPRERLIVALDARGGKVVDHGWTRATGADVLERARSLEPYCSEFLYTLVDREGSLRGIDLPAVRALVEATKNRVVAAGGIATREEVSALRTMGASCQLGMAIYTGAFELADAFIDGLDFSKHDGLIPVVVQDEAREVVMHAFANREAVALTLQRGEGWYYSRSRQALWQKGATSGHLQRIVSVRADCDGDTLLYRVAQQAKACHEPSRHGCFGPQRFDVEHLMATLRSRATDADVDPASYSARLLREPGLCEQKILEEAAELAEATSRREIVWEAADVVFFTLAKLAREGIAWQEVLRELDGRQGRRRVPSATGPEPKAAPARPTAPQVDAPAAQDPLAARVAALLAEARAGGDAALRAMSERFDGVTPVRLVVGKAALAAAFDALPAEEREALQRAHANIARVAEAQRDALSAFDIEVESGLRIGQALLPIRRVACYVPAGRHPLPSTVLMTVTPARVAGCEEVLVFSPPQRDVAGSALHGVPHPAILAAAHLAGADAVIALGGVQAVAAAAFGSESVPRCDLLVGPGNAYVTEAKRQVFGHIGIDGLAGPSEVLVLCDADADPERIAADLLAQAEHDPDARARVVTTDPAAPARVEAALARQLATLPTAETARAALAASGPAEVVADLAALIAAADAAAPEHLHLHLRPADAEAVAARCRCYGAVFVGADASEVFGDYCAGGNHVLPTAGAARFASGLSVATFTRLAASQRMTAKAAAALADVAARLARLEGLEAHARAAETRRQPPATEG